MREFKLFISISVVSLILLSGCSISNSKSESAPPLVINQIDNKLYNYGDYGYDYAVTEASPRTNMEPSPTSYVLFVKPTIEADGEVFTAQDYETYKGLEELQNERMLAYCMEHYSQFSTTDEAREKDYFGNIIKLYWPLKLTSDEETHINILRINGVELEERCAYLVEKYDFDRASGLIESFGFKKIITSEANPIFVLDFGFDSVVLPMGNVATEDLERIPPIWKQTIDDALKAAIGERESAKKSLSEINLIMKSPGYGNMRKKDRRDLEAQKESLIKRLFAKNSLGRAVACHFSGLIKERVINYIPIEQVQMLFEEKKALWCN